MRLNLIILALFSCLASLSAQAPGTEITLKDGSKFLLGTIGRERLKVEPYSKWFNSQYNAYEPQRGALSNLALHFDKVRILIFLGTWCGDSKREVPRFIKITDELDIPDSQINFISVDRRPGTYKTSPGGEHLKWNIKRVPTFILLRDGREIGRIVERPKISLEWDLCDLLQCAPDILRK